MVPFIFFLIGVYLALPLWDHLAQQLQQAFLGRIQTADITLPSDTMFRTLCLFLANTIALTAYVGSPEFFFPLMIVSIPITAVEWILCVFTLFMLAPNQ